MNMVILVGKVIKPPKYFITQKGKKCATFSLGVARTYRSKSGNLYDFVDCVAMDNIMHDVENYLQKGMRVLVYGKWTTIKLKSQKGYSYYANSCVCNYIEYIDQTWGGQKQNGNRDRQSPTSGKA